MSNARAFVQRIRSRIPWPQSSQTWSDLAIDLVFLAIISLLTIFSWFAWGSPVKLIVAWGLFASVLAILVYSGKLKLFGPVLFYDMIRTARRSRYAIMRFLYACFLLLMLLTAYTNEASWNGVNQQRAAVSMAMHFFEIFMIVQLVAVIILTPAYFGGALAEEKERKTLEFILATDLYNREIVLSKLGSRLANLFLFLLTGLPILSILQFLGGIDPNLVLMGFAATGLTVLGFGSASLLYSAIMQRSRDAIALSYGFILAYLGIATMAMILGFTPWGFMNFSFGLDYFMMSPPTLRDLSELLNLGNPIALIVAVGQSGSTGSLASQLPLLLRNYAAFHGLLAVICIGITILRLRPLSLRQPAARLPKGKSAPKRAPVGELPMIWKETTRGTLKLGWVAWLTFTPLALLTFGIGIWIIIYCLWEQHANFRNTQRDELGFAMNAWVRGAGTSVAMFTALWSAVRAATSISAERERETFDALISTQMTSNEILFAKLLGSMYGTRLGVYAFALMIGMALLTGGLHIAAVPVAIAGCLVYMAFFSILGLWFSMKCRNSQLATTYTVMVSLFTGGGHMIICGSCCAIAAFSSNANAGGREWEHLWLFWTFATIPPLSLGGVLFNSMQLSTNFDRSGFEILFDSTVGIISWAIASLILWHLLLAPRFRMMMRRELYLKPRTPRNPDQIAALSDTP